MSKINVAIVHGIGINAPGYADSLIKGVIKQFNKYIQSILKTSDDYSDQLYFIPIIWDDIVAFQQAALADIFRKEFNRRKKKRIFEILKRIGIWLVSSIILYFLVARSFVFLIMVVPILYYAPKWIYKLRTSFAAEFVCDITSYNEKGAKKLILQRIEERLQPIINISEVTNISFISHSLGTVIASDFVWEEEEPAKLFDKKLFLSNFFTMGSPLPLFSLQFGGPEVFNKPITIQDLSGRWVNIYDKDDPIAYSLKPLNDAYDRVVLKDQEVNVGIFGIAHLKYWTDQKVHQIIAHKLALDWLRFNNKLDKIQLDRFYSDYDNNIGL